MREYDQTGYRFFENEAKQWKDVMLTAYDYPSAKLAEQGDVDVILVGDLLGMVVLGYDSTVPVTLQDMIHHRKLLNEEQKIHLSLPICHF